MENAELIRNKHVAFLASFHNPAVIFEQISVIYALPRLFVGSFTLVLPFFPTGTLERVSGMILDYRDLIAWPDAVNCFHLDSGGDGGRRCNGLHSRPHPHQYPALTRGTH